MKAEQNLRHIFQPWTRACASFHGGRLDPGRLSGRSGKKCAGRRYAACVSADGFAIHETFTPKNHLNPAGFMASEDVIIMHGAKLALVSVQKLESEFSDFGKSLE